MNNINKEEAAGIITRILMACRIPSNWAKVLAGAIIGAVVAWMSLTQSSCASKTQADPPGHTGISIQNGQYTLTRDGRTLTWDDKTHSLVWTQAAPETSVPPVVQQVK